MRLRFKQNDWPDGHRLAATIQFRFPECQKIELSALIGRASVHGLQLLEDCLQWDPDKRPTAQQALKYPFFQIIKRVTDTVHTIPLTTSHISQQQQQSSIQSHHHQSTIPNGRTSNMSFASLDNDDNKFTGDSEFVRTYGVASHTTIYPSNGIKQIVLENNRRNSISNNNNNNRNSSENANSNANDLAEDTIKSMNIENGINFSLFKGAFNNSSALNNHHQPERSLDTSENVSQPIGYNSLNSRVNNASLSDSNKMIPNQIANYRDAVDVGSAISSSTITQTSRDSPMPNSNAFTGNVRQNGSAITTARIQTNDTLQSASNHRHHAPLNGYANDMKSVNNELFNGFESRRGSRSKIDENPFFKEKISDIFVNRIVGGGAGAPNGKLYNGNNGSLHNSMMYANPPLDATSNEYRQKNKAFFLHDANKPTIDDSIYANADAKVYNIFSKQRLAKSFTQDKSKNAGGGGGGGGEQNSYLAMKLPTVAPPIKQQTQKMTQTKAQPSWDSFEDDELAKILG